MVPRIRHPPTTRELSLLSYDPDPRTAIKGFCTSAVESMNKLELCKQMIIKLHCVKDVLQRHGRNCPMLLVRSLKLDLFTVSRGASHWHRDLRHRNRTYSRLDSCCASTGIR